MLDDRRIEKMKRKKQYLKILQPIVPRFSKSGASRKAGCTVSRSNISDLENRGTSLSQIKRNKLEPINPAFRGLGGILILLLSLSCNPPKGKTKAEVIEERIAYRMGNWTHTYKKQCREDVLEAAAAIVDSTLIVNARRHKDTLDRPFRPSKPDNPNFVAPEDTVPVAPLVDLDSLFLRDSLEILQDSIIN